MDALDFAALWVSATGAIAVGAWVCVQLWKAARPRGMATKCTRFPP